MMRNIKWMGNVTFRLIEIVRKSYKNAITFDSSKKGKHFRNAGNHGFN